jgi:hypothetical protein
MHTLTAAKKSPKQKKMYVIDNKNKNNESIVRKKLLVK